jgi:hypothetical protein
VVSGGGGGGEGVSGGGGGVNVARVVGNARRNRAGGVDGGMLVAQALGPPAWNRREEALSLSAGAFVGLLAHTDITTTLKHKVQTISDAIQKHL